jgi:transcriptional regulator with XRE-family HTH domain
MKHRSRFKTLRDYVNAQPRTKSQNEIAEDLGISPSALSLYLNGHRIPAREIALRLSRQCGVPLESLLDPETVRA